HPPPPGPPGPRATPHAHARTVPPARRGARPRPPPSHLPTRRLSRRRLPNGDASLLRLTNPESPPVATTSRPNSERIDGPSAGPIPSFPTDNASCRRGRHPPVLQSPVIGPDRPGREPGEPHGRVERWRGCLGQAHLLPALSSAG